MPRELPHNNEAEQAILGALLVYPDVATVVVDEGLLVKDFYLAAHQTIFEAMLDLLDDNKPIEPKLLLAYLKDNEKLAVAGGVDYILQLADSAISGANAKYYIDLVRTKSDQRHLIETTQALAERGFDESEPVDDLLDEAERKILEVTRERRGLTAFRSSSEVADQVIQEISYMKENNTGMTGVITGFPDLDRLTNGLQKGDLIILAARPSVGKTAFALNLGLNASKNQSDEGAKRSIALFSLEMPAEQLMRRILSSQSGVNGSKLKNGYLNESEMASLYGAVNILKTCKLFIDDSPSVKIPEIFSKCRKLKSEHGLDLIIIDYLQLIASVSRRGSDNRQQEVSDISRSLKALARELEVPVISLSQLSRSIEQRKDKIPQLSDLRESGSIEQDADIVMFLSREDYQESDDGDDGDDKVEVLLSVKKHRNGALKDIKLSFEKSINKFYPVRSEKTGYND